jgi:hypothetical protein
VFFIKALIEYIEAIREAKKIDAPEKTEIIFNSKMIYPIANHLNRRGIFQFCNKTGANIFEHVIKTPITSPRKFLRWKP